MRRFPWKLSFLTFLLCAGGWQRVARADLVLSFTGDLKTDANISGGGYTLDQILADNSDPEWAQFTGFAATFHVSDASAMKAITFSYGGGTNGHGTVIQEGGFTPYLSLFDSAGHFLGSTLNGSYCPAGANTNAVSGYCNDALLDGGTLAPGDYEIVISAWENMSYAENLGTGTLADGLTGLGNFDGTGPDELNGPTDGLQFAFDVILSGPEVNSVPEPSSLWLLITLAPAVWKLSRRR
ncbi:MAG TPA: DVUA0089 family protein [Bryobacteraceae bacterium]|nr:DVUA0089 family protein [Bryobacteraceae bacterium]